MQTSSLYKEIQTTHISIPDHHLPFQSSFWCLTCLYAPTRYNGHSSHVPPSSLTPCQTSSFPHTSTAIGILSLLWTLQYACSFSLFPFHFIFRLFKCVSYWVSPRDTEERRFFMENQLKAGRQVRKQTLKHTVINGMLSVIHEESWNREAVLPDCRTGYH